MKARYIGATLEQVNFGNCADPRGVLTERKVYEVARVEPHSWHTKFFLVGFPDLGFNSVCFKEIKQRKKAAKTKGKRR
jgi:hypothetical protein